MSKFIALSIFRKLWRCILVGSLVLGFAHTLPAQSTLGTILGTVQDSTKSVIPQATVVISDIDTGASRSVMSDEEGNYAAINMAPGHYLLRISHAGFRDELIQNIQLVARQQLRVNATLSVGAVSQTVTVQGGTGVITTDTPEISSSFDAKQILDLPANYRGNGTTSAFSLLQALPGVQADTQNASTGGPPQLSVQGGLPFQSGTTVDGISTQNVTDNISLSEAMPSADSIAEIRVDGVLVPAEYSQPGQITTISKSGTNQYHGSIFYYHQNSALDAIPFGALTKPAKIGNDYGASIGGPIIIPHYFNGHNKTFFFGTFEGFRFPHQEVQQEEVPTQNERNGNFSNESGTILNPSTGKPFPGNVIPSGLSNTANAILALYPLPNAGNTQVEHAANYVVNKSNNYDSNQFDTRIDQYFGSKLLVFGRYTWKSIDVDTPQPLLVPESTDYDRYNIFVLAANYALSPHLENEFRFGYTLNNSGTANSFDGPAFEKSLGLTGFTPNYRFNGLPEIDFTTLSSLTADRLNSTTQSNLYEYNDNFSWIHGRHTMKFGFDILHLNAVTPLGFFGGDNYGNFQFTGEFTNNEVADFMLGLPQQTELDNVQADNNGFSTYWSAFAQDQFQVTHSLTLSYGLRYSFNPPFTSPTGYIGNFDPSIPLSGRVLYPTGKEDLLAPGLLASFNACPAPDQNGAPCTPVVSAQQAHLPDALRKTTKLRFSPRFGFAYRLFGGDRTVVRGGFGIYDITLLGGPFYSLTGTLQSDTRKFTNTSTSSGPAFQWPQVSPGGSGIITTAYGTATFGTANQIDWKDPYSMQWDLSVDHQFVSNLGLRAAYIALKTDDLVWGPNLNDMSLSTGYASLRPLSDRPFPNWGTIYTRINGAQESYNSMQVEATRRFVNDLTFDSTYTFAKNLADNLGKNGSSFSGEGGGGRALWLYDRSLEYGQVYGTRKHRSITTANYELPFGRGRHFGSSMNHAADLLLGGWQLNNIFLWQTGPHLTPYFKGGDPSGTGAGTIVGVQQPPDLVGNPVPHNQGHLNWVNPAAFVCPGTPGWAPATSCTIGSNPKKDLPPIGRFGTVRPGGIVGPGTVALSSGISKTFAVSEHVRVRAEASFTNVLNHTNLDDPALAITAKSFGQITDARTSEFGGPRTGQGSLRIEF